MTTAIGDGVRLPQVVIAAVPIVDGEFGQGSRAGLYDTLELIQAWLQEPGWVQSRLVVVTRNALAAVKGETPELGLAAVDGLFLRSAASQHPGRFALLDLDDSPASVQALPAALSMGEPRLAIREGRVLAPRLQRVTVPNRRADGAGVCTRRPRC